MKYLFLDDIRVPADVTWINIPDAEWEIARSYNEAVTWVTENGFPDFVSFDHDLGYEEWQIDSTTGIAVVTSAKEEKSGYDFAKFLIELDMDTKSMPIHFAFTVHSINPVGIINIRKILENYIKFKGEVK